MLVKGPIVTADGEEEKTFTDGFYIKLPPFYKKTTDHPLIKNSNLS